MSKKSSIIILSCTLISVIAISLILYQINFKKISYLPTYFSYTDIETKPLMKLDSKKSITLIQLKQWDDIMFDLVKENKLGDAFAGRIYAYVYVAQRDAAFLSYNLNGSYKGDIDVITAQVLCEFLHDQCAQLKDQINPDPYSEALAAIVMNKVKARINADNENIKTYEPLIGKQYWDGQKPYFAENVGSWKTWLIHSGSEFRAPAPPNPNSSEWQHQLELTKEALNNITPQQKKSTVFWAGNPGTITPAGLWLRIANDYMQASDISIEKQLLVRSVLAMGIEDAAIAVYDSKYTYWIRRPNMLDTEIITVMPTPNHPSYPAGHSTLSSAASTILSYYFPDKKAQWDKDATEASFSRVWGGIHFPIDAEQGSILGQKVGESVVRSQVKALP